MDELHHKISRRTSNWLHLIMAYFREFREFSQVVGAIDGTHFHVRKPNDSPEDYFYFKSGGFTMQCQPLVDRKFFDISVRMLGLTNDVRQLRRSMIYQRATSTNMFNLRDVVDGIFPYLVGDKGYPLFFWVITPYQDVTGEAICPRNSFQSKALPSQECGRKRI